MTCLPTNTSTDVASSEHVAAVLPVGAFEQHGDHLPLATDTMIACLVAKALADRYSVFVLPPLTISCSHEHEDFPGTVSIQASTLTAIITDIQLSLARQGIDKLVIINAHGGNYVLGNVVQQANVSSPTMGLFPRSGDWNAARHAAGMESTGHDDMHGGELETSILLAFMPEVVRDSYVDADHSAGDRPDLLTLGMSAYTPTGIIGLPSAATAEKGRLAMDSLTDSFKRLLDILP